MTYTIKADNVVLYDATGNQLYPAPPQPPSGGPPGPITNVLSTDSIATIQSKLNAVPAGGSLVFPSMAMPGGNLNGKSGITLWASDNVTANGTFNFASLTGWMIRGVSPGHGFNFSTNNRITANNAKQFSIGNCGFTNVSQAPDTWNGGSIQLNGASYGLIINNDFVGCQGNVLGMYSLDNMTFDGNHFSACNQPVSVQGQTDGTLGRNLVWQRNVFTGTLRAAIEVGPSSAAGQFFDGLIVANNWFDDFNPSANNGTMLPISLVGQAAKNTTVTNNYISKGSRPNAQVWAPGIEFTGTGVCELNTLSGWAVAGYLYQSGWLMRNNTFFQTGGFVNNGQGTGTLGPENVVTTAPPIPAWPTRITW